MGKVVMTKDTRIEKNFPAEWPAIVQVHLMDGKQLEKYIRFPKGDPENPLTWQELSAKFQSLATRVFPKTRCDQIVNSVKDMNPSTELRTIWKLAAGPASLSLPAN
jgi:2-methylcitrate dehydratase PrpD